MGKPLPGEWEQDPEPSDLTNTPQAAHISTETSNSPGPGPVNPVAYGQVAPAGPQRTGRCTIIIVVQLQTLGMRAGWGCYGGRDIGKLPSAFTVSGAAFFGWL